MDPRLCDSRQYCCSVRRAEEFCVVSSHSRNGYYSWILLIATTCCRCSTCSLVPRTVVPRHAVPNWEGVPKRRKGRSPDLTSSSKKTKGNGSRGKLKEGKIAAKCAVCRQLGGDPEASSNREPPTGGAYPSFREERKATSSTRGLAWERETREGDGGKVTGQGWKWMIGYVSAKKQ